MGYFHLVNFETVLGEGGTPLAENSWSSIVGKLNNKDTKQNDVEEEGGFLQDLLNIFDHQDKNMLSILTK